MANEKDQTDKGQNTNGGTAITGTGKKDGDYKNVETAVNNPDYFNDDDAVQREEQISEDNARSEDEGRNGKQ